MLFLYILIGLVAVGAITAANSLKIIRQYERGVLFRLGRVRGEAKEPGLTAIIPFADRLQRVSMQIITMPIPAQDGITRDNVTVRVDAVIYFKVVDPRKAIVDVEDYNLAVGQVAQTSPRSIIGQSELDDLLTNRERLNQGLAIMIDSPAVDWGIHIDRVEIKDVALPEAMKRSMSRQAEAERERRSRIIIADGEPQASNKLSQAAGAMADTPAPSSRACSRRSSRSPRSGIRPSSFPSPSNSSGSSRRIPRSHPREQRDPGRVPRVPRVPGRVAGRTASPRRSPTSMWPTSWRPRSSPSTTSIRSSGRSRISRPTKSAPTDSTSTCHGSTIPPTARHRPPGRPGDQRSPSPTSRRCPGRRRCRRPPTSPGRRRWGRRRARGHRGMRSAPPRWASPPQSRRGPSAAAPQSGAQAPT